LVPLIARRLPALLALIPFSAATLAIGYLIGLRGDWSNKFVVFEAVWFGLGALAAHAYCSRPWKVSAEAGWLAVVTFAALTLAWPEIISALPRRVPGLGAMIPWHALCLTATAALLPVAFAGLRRSALDGYIGRFSYPLYLVHPLPIFFGMSGAWAAVAAIAVTAPFVYLIEPLSERWRRRNAPAPGKPGSFRPAVVVAASALGADP
jgi:peptidoglycan/LPS O-acetylase OafA/YrhL